MTHKRHRTSPGSEGSTASRRRRDFSPDRIGTSTAGAESPYLHGTRLKDRPSNGNLELVKQGIKAFYWQYGVNHLVSHKA